MPNMHCLKLLLGNCEAQCIGARSVKLLAFAGSERDVIANVRFAGRTHLSLLLQCALVMESYLACSVFYRSVIGVALKKCWCVNARKAGTRCILRAKCDSCKL